MVAAGGSGLRADEEAKKSVEVLRLGLPLPTNPYGQRWLLLPSMQKARSNHGCCAGEDGRLYVLGGLDEQEEELQSVEAFTPAAGVWASWGEWSLPAPRFGCAAVSIGGASSLAVLGGTDVHGACLVRRTTCKALVITCVLHHCLQLQAGHRTAGRAVSTPAAACLLACS
eukprot:SAG22_NODE_1541_length_4174_cov_3.161227_3_plen_170_part_00